MFVTSYDFETTTHACASMALLVNTMHMIFNYLFNLQIYVGFYVLMSIFGKEKIALQAFFEKFETFDDFKTNDL